METRFCAKIDSSQPVHLFKATSLLFAISTSDTAGNCLLCSRGCIHSVHRCKLLFLHAGGGQEAGVQYDISETQILPPVESYQIWDSSLRTRSPSDRLKGGVDEDSLLALLMEDTPNGGDSVPPQSLSLVSPMPPRPPSKRNTYTSSVDYLNILPFYPMCFTSLSMFLF